MLITTMSDLDDMCEELIAKKPKFIAVDTEFIRNNLTYYPKLSLIQISYEEGSFIVDVLAPEIDLSLVKKVMLNQEITKVFHSCRQDIESLFTVFKCIPTPIFDTQVAAMFCHYYYNFISYSKLVEQYQGIVLNKVKAKNSDWLKRPLSEDQLDYAVSDVVHLYDLHQILHDKLKEKNRIGWFQEEMESVVDMDKYLHSPKDAWKRIKFNYRANPRLILTVKAVSEWQETLAQRYNRNRNRVINNSIISGFIERNVERIDEILDDLKENAKNIKEEDLLEFVDIFNENEKNFMQQNYTLSNYHDRSVFDMLSVILESKCKENNISRKLVSSKAELASSISGQIDKLFKGWRYDFFGKSVESFLNASSKFEISVVRFTNNITEIRSNLMNASCELKSTAGA
ncbi:ribonuclease D [Wolbachia endosymbiont of Dirofilaria (Dirofilaria) immitis]|uniref:ribonuclease D n=1 Tax=Wolbachia endosymbiont of Dirofilaria (Dirofilaria) immitis TaxID=1812115 RepID=UPI0015888F0F|nr:ribonuclease D [Wolbachia endosymbiont of Dirofilaria (Dirofilaria) immitis]QKX02618.1 ribonuclease D [Wolbachia endosymbiont of Dirofilaria (Dirofilaria) immitis]